jgi:hypothetical protein
MRFLNLYIQNKPPSPIPNELKVKGTNKKKLRDQNEKNQMTKKKKRNIIEHYSNIYIISI